MPLIARPDLLPHNAPSGIEVFQITHEDVPASHIYMEAQIFTPDSKRFLLHRSAHAHGSDPEDPEHKYMICDLESRGELTPLTEEPAAKAPCVTPDGNEVYYFVDETGTGTGRLMLKRVSIDGTQRETVLVVEGTVGDSPYRFSRGYPISTISSDGKRIVYSGFLGDGRPETATWGFLTFDLESAAVTAHPLGGDWHNLHPQYSRSLDAPRSRDVLVQQNHGSVTALDGTVSRKLEALGADVHVIRDDGTNFRDMPWGRDGIERCQGHQCWIGRSDRAISSMNVAEPTCHPLIGAREAPESGHMGARIPAAYRNHLTRAFETPQFFHFATDIQGKRFITDYRNDDQLAVYVAQIPEKDGGVMEGFLRVAETHGTWESRAHAHPFLSPDGRKGFFNSNETGILQAYMIAGIGNA